ncbi:Lactate utilization protein B [Phycisphaerae bacterium RAS1]|nr:Lactate utilization protein B [Phycisphaerae bacterium RAS1]
MEQARSGSVGPPRPTADVAAIGAPSDAEVRRYRTLEQRIAAAMADAPVIQSIRLATIRKVDQREAGMRALRDPEGLRELAARIKQHTLDQLPRYLEQFSRHAVAAGAQLHVADDAAAARRIIVEIARAKGSKLAVKVKSMTTEEVHLNDALLAAGVRTVETDLGEFIVQLDRDRPSHIVTPIIHKNRKQIAAAMQRELGVEYTEDPTRLSLLARDYLREVFRRCDLGVSGVNFAIAENGTIVICTNEGNGRMSTTRPRVHIALMGIEKLIPRLADLAVFLKLLARGSTGQPLTVYTTLINGARRAGEIDGPEELHIVLLDNGRSALLGGESSEVLRCIRCGACLNACPVYRNIGGHAYASVYPGPIGSLVSPLLTPSAGHHDLPRASSLCGACFAACPVKIDIPRQLVRLRATHKDRLPLDKRLGMKLWQRVMMSPRLYAWAQAGLRLALPGGQGGWVDGGPGPLKAWTLFRDLPPPAVKTFRQRWAEELADD